MTERGLPSVGGAAACPFVAFEDDRDERATSPDHRHRCYAEAQPAPRALAHQEAYCLSSAFPVCPTFQDWARREAARARPPDLPPAEPEDDEGLPPLVADRPPRRGSRATWSAPPPWLHGEGSATPAPSAASQAPAGPDESHDDARSAAGIAAATAAGGLSGSLADRMASDRGGGDVADWEDEAAVPPAGPAERSRDVDERSRYLEEAGDEDEAIAATPRPSRRRERLEAGSDRMESYREPDGGAPSWERPRRLEAYPTLRSRRWSSTILPSLLLALVALLLAGAALFFLPQLLGIGGPGPAASTNPSLSPSVAPGGETAGPSGAPVATPFLYTVQPGDTLTKIARKFGISLAALIDANKATHPNPNVLNVGDQLIIPTPAPSGLSAASPASSP